MTDERLQDLARRWRATGAPDDEAALFAERLRAGLLSRERVELAAHLGHPAAGLVVGAVPPAPPHEAWIAALDAEGAAAVASAWLRIARLRRPRNASEQRHAWQVFEALEEEGERARPNEALVTLLSALFDAWDQEPEDARGVLYHALLQAAQIKARGRVMATHQLEDVCAISRGEREKELAIGLTSGPIREAIAADLVRWALGPDPAGAAPRGS